MSEQLHRVQVSILGALPHTEDARFTMLMKPTGMESDTFKFHIRKLVRAGYIEKSATGRYRLTAAGKEFANNLDDHAQQIQKQPKLSVLAIVHRASPDGTTQYLVQKRQRNPFFDYWSCIGGPVQWGQTAEETAAKELYKQTGLTADFAVKAFVRKRDYEQESDHLLEDKLFIVTEATLVTGDLNNTWYGGQNAWMTLAEFKAQPKHFATVVKAIKMLASGQASSSEIAHYNLQDY